MDTTHCNTQSTGLRGTAPGSVSTSWHDHKERAKCGRYTCTKGARGWGGFGFHRSLTSHSHSFLNEKKEEKKRATNTPSAMVGEREGIGENLLPTEVHKHPRCQREKGVAWRYGPSSHDHDGGVAPTQGHGRPLGPHADLGVVRLGRVQGQRRSAGGEDPVVVPRWSAAAHDVQAAVDAHR